MTRDERTKSTLSARRFAQYGPMPASRAEWLAQLDLVAAELALENIYRRPALPIERTPRGGPMPPRNRFPDE